MSLSTTTVHMGPGGVVTTAREARQGRLLEEISAMYADIFGSESGPDREHHPVVFLPDGSKKGCKESGGMSAMGYLAFVVSGNFK